MSEATNIETDPRIGRYPTLSFADYLAIDAESASRLKALMHTAAHYKHAIDHPDDGKEETAAMRFGTAVHCALLEPEAFSDRYTIDPMSPKGGYPAGWRNTKDYKEQKAEILESGRGVLALNLANDCMRMRDKLYGEPSHARDLLMAKSATEVSYVIEDSFTGTTCKLRPDLEVDSGRIIVDLKKCAQISRFPKQIVDLKYNLSAAHYQTLLQERHEGNACDHFLWLVVEEGAPFEFRVIELDQAGREYSWRLWRRLMKQAKECRESGVYPGYPREVEAVSLPEWLFNVEEMEQ